MATGYNYWTWHKDPESPPIHYLRSFDEEKIKSGGFIQLGESPLSPHTALSHNKKLFPVGNLVQYKEVEGDPEGHANDKTTFEQFVEDPKLLFRYSSTHARYAEGDVMDLTLEYLPYALVSYDQGPIDVPYICQQAIIAGTYEGKEVKLLGAWDRIYRSTTMEATYGKIFIYLNFVGIRKDGCREYGIVMIFGNKGFGFYHKDGEDPIVTTEVTMEATWEPVTYLSDETASFTKAAFHFGGKVIHYKAKWGFRGWDEESRLSLRKHGYNLTAGSWYEGSTPYIHDTTFTFGESHEAFVGKVEPYLHIKPQNTYK